MAHTTELAGPDFAIGIAMSELPENTPVLGHARGKAVVLIRTGVDVRALEATCSHYGGPLWEGLVVGETLRCPWHHACFDMRTGEALGAPALNPIACYEVERRGERVIVGVNKYVDEEEPPIPTLKIDPAVERAQRDRVITLRGRRDQARATAALDAVRAACRGTDNLMPPIIEAVKADVTLGEICDVFREVFGVYRDPVFV